MTATPVPAHLPVELFAGAGAVAVALRPAGPADAEPVWRWNFAADVRARSRRGEAVAFDDHARWFRRRLADGGAPIWIIERGGAALGVVRIDRADAGRGRISIALAAEARGQGVGRAAVSLACHAWRRPVTAEIFADNIRSRSCFEACGFRKIADHDGLVTYHWDLENR